MKIDPKLYGQLETVAAFAEEFFTGVPEQEAPDGVGDRIDESATYSERVYAVYCDSMGGFPGLWQLCVLAAHAFNETHKTVNWGEVDFVETLHEYVFAIDEYLFDRDDLLYLEIGDPIGDLADEFPRLAQVALERSKIHT